MPRKVDWIVSETSVSARKTRQGPSWLVSVLALAAFATLIALGTWQVQRLFWKENLLGAIAERTQGAPVALDEVVRRKAAGEPVEYYKVTVTGEFDHNGEQFFFATHQGRSGYFVYTPLARSDGSLVFVNRGFVPLDFKDPETRPEGQLEGEVTISGLVREPLTEKPSWVVPDNDPEKNIFFWKDIAGLAKNAGLDRQKLLDIYVDADNTPVPGGLPEGGVTIIDLPNSHLQYAVTWYGLALALAGVFAVRFFRRAR